MPPKETSPSQIIANVNAPMRTEFYSPSTLIRPIGPNEADKYTSINQFTISVTQSRYSYTQENGCIVNCVKTTMSSSQCHIIPSVQNNNFRRIILPSTFPSINETPFQNVHPTSNLFCQMPLTTDASAANFQLPSHQLSSVYQYLPNDN